MAHPLSLLSVTDFLAILAIAMCIRAKWVPFINITCPTIPMSAFFHVVVAPLSHITPFPPSVTWHTFSLSPAPAHTEFRLCHSQRFIGVKATAYLPVLTADGIR